MQPTLPSSGKEKVQNENVEFLQHLTGRETVGIDREGRLYSVSGVMAMGLTLGKLFKSSREMDQAVNDSLKMYLTQKRSEWLQGTDSMSTIRTFYDRLIGNLERSKILSDANKELLIRDKYDQIYRALVADGRAPWVAESIVTIEMSQDSTVPEALRRAVQPELTRSGVNGTYIIKNRNGENIGIFKPSDEEVNMPNNPRVQPHEAEKYDKAHPKRLPPYKGHLQGTGWTKEIAAYSISKEVGLGDVPVTLKLSVPYPERHGSTRLIQKEGSLQKFVVGDALEKRKYEDLMKVPTKEVQKIVLLDLLIGNADRNLGNCFIKGNGDEASLIPIDHGFSLLDSVVSSSPKTETNCHLASLPQVQQPCEKDLVSSVLALTPEAVGNIVASLKRRGIPFTDDSLKEFKLRLMITQFALKEGYTLAKLTPMLMFMGGTPLIETLAKDHNIDELIKQWELLEGDIGRLSPTLGKEIEKFQASQEEVTNLKDELE
jgi:hypothetical protein